MEPQIRASLMRLYLEYLPACGEAEAAARAALGPEAILRIERAAGHEWLPMAWEMALLRAVHAAGGDEGVRALGREVGKGAITSPLLRPVVSAVLGMLGRKPEALIQLALAGWRVAVRDAGHATIASRRSGEVRIAYDGIPPIARHRAHLLRTCASMEALFLSAGLYAHAEPEWTEGAPSAVQVVAWARRGRGDGDGA